MTFMTKELKEDFEIRYGSFEFSPSVDKEGHDKLEEWIDQNFISRKEIEAIVNRIDSQLSHPYEYFPFDQKEMAYLVEELESVRDEIKSLL